MKLRFSLVLLSCFLSLVTGLVLCRGRSSEQAAARGRVLIGFSMDTLKEERWQHDRDFFVAHAKELGADVLVQAANSDDTRQIADVEALISRKINVLVIAPHNGAAMAKAVDMAHEAGIPVISYDRLITGGDPDLYISFDAVRIGEMQAQFLVDQIGSRLSLPSEARIMGSGNKFLAGEQMRRAGHMRIVRINGAKTDHNAVLVQQGQDNILKPFIKRGEIEIILDDWAENWKPENAKKITNAAITRFGHNFDAILAANDGTAGGAIQALMEEGLAGKVIVTGQDAELAACQRIVNGTQTMTIYKSLKKLAERAAETAIKMASGKPVIAADAVDNGKIQVPSILMPVMVTTRENMVQTVVQDGYQTFDDVYRGASQEAIAAAQKQKTNSGPVKP